MSRRNEQPEEKFYGLGRGAATEATVCDHMARFQVPGFSPYVTSATLGTLVCVLSRPRQCPPGVAPVSLPLGKTAPPQ